MSEEVTRRNVLAIKEHSEGTRKELREMQIQNAALKLEVESIRLEQESLRTGLQTIQIKVFSGGATT
jgi:hypothetical protein